MSEVSSRFTDGLLLVNKPSKLTSHDVVARVRRILGTKSVGHAGTLDPLASGLLVLLCGEATKISDYVLSGDKSYRVKVLFGVETDTLDTDGEVLREEAVQLDKAKLKEAALALVGDYDWPVPIHSAVKKNGKKLYEYARKGDQVVIPIKKMSYWDVNVLEVSGNGLEADLTCSKGSYIRTWSSQLGKALGVPATMAGLVRTQSAPYDLENAIKLEDLEGMEKNELDGIFRKEGSRHFVPLSQTLKSWKTVTIKGKDHRLLSHGQVSHDLSRRLVFDLKEAFSSGRSQKIRVLSGETGGLLAILEALPAGGLKVRRVFKN